MTPRQKFEVRERVRLALQKLPPELRKGKGYPYARIVTKIVKDRDRQP